MFVLGDVLVFSLFFGTFLFYRNEQIALFQNSQLLLNRHYGAINTLLLLTSSWFLATAVHHYRNGDSARTTRLIALTFFCGLGFAAIKVAEFGQKFAAGISLTTNDFFTFYFMFTGIHFVHVLIGLGVLLLIWRVGARRPTDKNIVVMENGATFWHMVDLLWIVLFTLIYLLH